MDTPGRLFAGSRNRNEFVVINADDVGKSKPFNELSGQICHICGDGVEVLEKEKESFVACHECAFPVCKTCYEYERREGSQACPQCKTRYKRHKGSARVAGDEEEDGDEDLDDEFCYMRDRKYAMAVPDAMGGAASNGSHHGLISNIPLLTYGEGVDGISADSHALIIPSFIGGGKPPTPYHSLSASRPEIEEDDWYGH